MRCSADWVRRLPSLGAALGSGDMPRMNTFTGVIGVVRRAFGLVSRFDMGAAWKRLRRGNVIRSSCRLRDAACWAPSSRSIINDGAKSASLHRVEWPQSTTGEP